MAPPSLAMQTQIAPKWLTLEQGQNYCGLNIRTLQNYIRDGLIESANVKAPNATRGRRLIKTESLDAFIERHVGAAPFNLKMNVGQ